jgi:hypothetical protein
VTGGSRGVETVGLGVGAWGAFAVWDRAGYDSAALDYLTKRCRRHHSVS